MSVLVSVVVKSAHWEGDDWFAGFGVWEPLMLWLVGSAGRGGERRRLTGGGLTCPPCLMLLYPWAGFMLCGLAGGRSGVDMVVVGEEVATA